ncbi:serine hydrolase domain-containing protein [Methylobrevis pamukkalensis]|nr:serine hydrolase [Methylobrevis pamukkalensis]
MLAVAPARAETLPQVLEQAEELAPLQTVVVARQGEIIAERGYRGHSPDAATPIMSASKSVVSALVGIAIDKGVFTGPDQRIAPLLVRDLPAAPDPRLQEITIGHLLSMQAGLASTSGPNYGAWIASSNWVRAVLSQPFEDDPGGRMIYSTGSSHLLSALLARATGRSTLDLARDWLGEVPGFSIAGWDRDPQGIHVGGNLMAMTPKSLLAFGEVYRRNGLAPDGRRVVSKDWIEASWQPRTASRWTGDDYGYGWFTRTIAGQQVRFGWGYGGQMVYVIPSLEMTVVITSDIEAPAGRSGHRDDLHRLLGEIMTVAAAPARPEDAAEGQEPG